MNVNKLNTQPILKSDLARVDAHQIEAAEYDELPELTPEMLARAVLKKAGRPLSPAPRELISLRVPVDILQKWRASGPGWQTRLVQRLIDNPQPVAG